MRCIANDELTPSEPVLGDPADEIRDRATGGMSRPVAGRHGRSREWYVVDERQVRVGAGVVAAVLVVAAGFWAWRAVDLRDRQDAICEACGNDAFQWVQGALSVVGVVLALVLAAYLLRIAVTGRTWPYRRIVTIVFLAVAFVWSVLVIAVALGPF